jgi:hypothetical protein
MSDLRANLTNEHPTEFWMWGREAAIGTSLFWRIHHKVFRQDRWVFDIPYACSDEAFARLSADKMTEQKSHTGRQLYREVTVSGPHISWREVWWKYK